MYRMHYDHKTVIFTGVVASIIRCVVFWFTYFIQSVLCVDFNTTWIGWWGDGRDAARVNVVTVILQDWVHFEQIVYKQTLT